VLIAAEARASYPAAQAAFARRDYVTSAPGFFFAYQNPRDGAERVKAEWGLAQSLHNLGFYYSASKYYSQIVLRGPRDGNTFFRPALEELGKINATISLGQGHIVQLFKNDVDPSLIPDAARGFYFYYRGIEHFNKKQESEARENFRRVPATSSYYLRAVFHQAVIAARSGRTSEAIGLFERVLASAGEDDRGDFLREQANLNIARVHYEEKRYREALGFYRLVPRESDNWLQTQFEGAWTFFMLQKHNETLGSILTLHSPFFENRFFPESYILSAITWLRLCRYDEVAGALGQFKQRYQPVFTDLKAMLSNYRENPKAFFALVYGYRTGSSDRYRRAWAVLDSLSRTDIYKEAADTIRFSDRELARIMDYRGKWGSTGLSDDLAGFLRKKKEVAESDAGRRLFDGASNSFAYLRELSEQSKMIGLEMRFGKIDALRTQINVGTAEKRVVFIGGMQELQVGQDIEYWPFQGEFWEDELGQYQYNVDSVCGKK
jgi:tetratricopeptide (TPR) repeat protein